ncbi:MAG: hypothetical protein AMQ22_01773 [Candidatus Methanofastidiosum methylothiophilum]|uniref:Uncharacterized protein n=1 Tax=Candidatus Methanofastidiosum methylothiophilum TaxID=1705564 RepID=A0A150IVJ9_9EURY|nr:MAG: hypothetical protein AMQ22_01773 [Candidatus Methanofastidiosum methylthiophilus]
MVDIKEMEKRVKEYERERKGYKKKRTKFSYIDLEEPEKSVDRRLKTDDFMKRQKKRGEMIQREEATGYIDLESGEVEEYYRKQPYNKGKKYLTKDVLNIKRFIL